MKQKYWISIIGASIVFTVITSFLLLSQHSDQNLESMEFIQIMTVEFEPSEIKGVNRNDYPKEPISLTEQDFDSVPKIRKMLEYTLADSKIPGIREPAIYVEEYPPSKYIVSRPGPFTYNVESYIVSGELEYYHSWIDKNLILGLKEYDGFTRYYFEYKGEIFRLEF